MVRVNNKRQATTQHPEKYRS